MDNIHLSETPPLPIMPRWNFGNLVEFEVMLALEFIHHASPMKLTENG